LLADKKHTEEFERCIEEVMAGGKEKGSAFAICTTSFEQAGKPIFEGDTPKRQLYYMFGEFTHPPDTNRVYGQALHPIKTYHPGEWPEVRVYLEEELKKSAETLTGKPFGVDHLYLLSEPNKVTRSWWENDAIHFEGEVDDDVKRMIENGEIKGVSVEYDWDILQNMDGVAPKGLEFTSLHFLKHFQPGDQKAFAAVYEAIIQRLKEAKASVARHVAQSVKEQAEPQEFIYYPIRDPAAFLEERFSTIWIDQNSGIQGIYGRLREDSESPQPMALLFMKQSGWTIEKMRDWLNNHPQYVRQSAEPVVAVAVQPASPPPTPAQTSTLIGEQKTQEKKEPSQLPKQEQRPAKMIEAEWTTEYVNNLDDSAFAAIEPGGEKDDQGKTTPRSLRHLEHHNAQGNVDEPHVKAALQRLNQTKISDALKAEAKKHLCGHAEELKIESEVCGLAERAQVEKKPVGEAIIPSQVPQQPQPNDLISKREVLALLPEEWVIRAWSYGPRLLVRQLRYKLQGEK
jgi:hypothetical protein